MSLHPEIVALVRMALAEDIGPGDVTTELTIEADRKAVGRFYAKQELVCAGTELLSTIFEDADKLEIYLPSAARCEIGDCIAQVKGPARLLLSHERVALNFLQRLSGIATLARRFADAVHGTGAKVLDTRKTTPGLRRLEKMAAHAGGIANHRMGLFDSILIKNNHISACGGITAALERTRHAKVPVEIEVRTREELEEALAWGAHHLLLDNLTPEEAREWIGYIRAHPASHEKPAIIELSGGVTVESVRAYAEAGPDFVSAGAITHSAPAVDINFRVELI
jgi:nicotinate-nucleotide pyrophosphorylase (carboxylating)